MFDTHLHTEFSTDSKMKIEKALGRARELDIGITVTEHMDLNCPIQGKFTFDVDEYFRRYSKFRSQNVLLGIEIGMGESCLLGDKSIESKYEFDYVLGSIHIVDGMDIYYESFYKDKSKKEAYNRYFDTMLKCLKLYDFIDCLAHIDYICRYSKYDDNEIYYEQFKDRIDDVLKAVAETEKALEINTRRLQSKKAVDALIPIYKRFKEIGGKYVTIGSDAHNDAAIGANFDTAQYIADCCGLKNIYFKQRKKEYVH
jgi:histidinol-phosphatase (PHP family)